MHIKPYKVFLFLSFLLFIFEMNKQTNLGIGQWDYLHYFLLVFLFFFFIIYFILIVKPHSFIYSICPYNKTKTHMLFHHLLLGCFPFRFSSPIAIIILIIIYFPWLLCSKFHIIDLNMINLFKMLASQFSKTWNYESTLPKHFTSVTYSI